MRTGEGLTESGCVTIASMVPLQGEQLAGARPESL